MKCKISENKKKFRDQSRFGLENRDEPDTIQKMFETEAIRDIFEIFETETRPAKSRLVSSRLVSTSIFVRILFQKNIFMGVQKSCEYHNFFD